MQNNSKEVNQLLVFKSDEFEIVDKVIYFKFNKAPRLNHILLFEDTSILFQQLLEAQQQRSIQTSLSQARIDYETNTEI